VTQAHPTDLQRLRHGSQPKFPWLSLQLRQYFYVIFVELYLLQVLHAMNMHDGVLA
jgi:hypothetical protein